MLAIANELWKLSTLTSSNDHVEGSPEVVVQVRTAGSLLVQLVGVSIVRALIRGRRAAR